MGQERPGRALSPDRHADRRVPAERGSSSLLHGRDRGSGRAGSPHRDSRSPGRRQQAQQQAGRSAQPQAQPRCSRGTAQHGVSAAQLTGIPAQHSAGAALAGQPQALPNTAACRRISQRSSQGCGQLPPGSRAAVQGRSSSNGRRSQARPRAAWEEPLLSMRTIPIRRTMGLQDSEPAAEPGERMTLFGGGGGGERAQNRAAACLSAVSSSAHSRTYHLLT